MFSRLSIVFALVLLTAAGCSKPPASSVTGPDRVSDRVATSADREEDESGFVPYSNNPYFPLVPGTTFYYRSKTDEGTETEQVTVTHDTKVVMGVTTRVVEDIVKLNGQETEHTFDYFAMDEEGAVWYFGEDSRDADGSTEGSWLAGVDGAQPGIIMLAHPQVGQTYNEENAPGVAQDQATVLSLRADAEVKYGEFERALKTKNFSALEPDALENKYYARGVGLILEVDVEAGGVRNELVRITRPRDWDDDDDRKSDHRRRSDDDRSRPVQVPIP